MSVLEGVSARKSKGEPALEMFRELGKERGGKEFWRGKDGVAGTDNSTNSCNERGSRSESSAPSFPDSSPDPCTERAPEGWQDGCPVECPDECRELCVECFEAFRRCRDVCLE